MRKRLDRLTEKWYKNHLRLLSYTDDVQTVTYGGIEPDNSWWTGKSGTFVAPRLSIDETFKFITKPICESKRKESSLTVTEMRDKIVKRAYKDLATRAEAVDCPLGEEEETKRLMKQAYDTVSEHKNGDH